ncbi:MAG TPA: hydroxyethylthiazole kinase [Kiritimatiellia bacterium]|nr:hydroxyethylthiazole kinase [Kiritimatiellia bacterium]HMP35177.1 hydroxyethylthiazole kinase [Kiritimatiellia bacterium]
MQAETIWADVEAIRKRSPLVHNITNYVVMNTTANALLALGASPVMAHAVEEVADMVGLTRAVGGALVINIGTLSAAWVDAMEKAMRAAAGAGVPIVLDPVGAGATPLRTAACARLLDAAPVAVIRGNASEILAVAGEAARARGVDSAHGTDAALAVARGLARQRGCVVSVSGAVDLVTDGSRVIEVRQGVPMMTRVTGLGCTASALTGAFVAVNGDRLAAAAHAMAVMGMAGEIAAEGAEGPGSLQVRFIDALYNLGHGEIAARLVRS